MTQPALFISHGSPMFAIEPGDTGPALRAFGQSLLGTSVDGPATPLRAVVLMSPHWMDHGIAVMRQAQPGTWHDFGGFAPVLYTLQYPAPSDTALADRVIGCFAAAGMPARADAQRPFDHGAWVPLMHLLPQAQVPVVQVALPVGAGPADVLAMGRALAPLRAEGVLVVGSGSMTHNLREFFTTQPPRDAPASPYVERFARWVEQRVRDNDLAGLLGYEATGPEALRAHPSDDHFLPLFFALGAGGWGRDAAPRVDYLSREVVHGLLAMDAFALQD